MQRGQNDQIGSNLDNYLPLSMNIHSNDYSVILFRIRLVYNTSTPYTHARHRVLVWNCGSVRFQNYRSYFAPRHKVPLVHMAGKASILLCVQSERGTVYHQFIICSILKEKH